MLSWGKNPEPEPARETRELQESRWNDAFQRALRLHAAVPAGSCTADSAPWKTAQQAYAALLQDDLPATSRVRFLCLKNAAALHEALPGGAGIQDAVTLCLEAADIDGSDIAFWLQLARLATRCSRRRLARAALEQVLQLRPDHAVSLRLLRDAVTHLGDAAAAAALTRRIQCLNPWDSGAVTSASTQAAAQQQHAGLKQHLLTVQQLAPAVCTVDVPSWTRVGQLLLELHADMLQGYRKSTGEPVSFYSKVTFQLAVAPGSEGDAPLVRRPEVQAAAAEMPEFPDASDDEKGSSNGTASKSAASSKRGKGKAPARSRASARIQQREDEVEAAAAAARDAQLHLRLANALTTVTSTTASSGNSGIGGSSSSSSSNNADAEAAADDTTADAAAAATATAIQWLPALFEEQSVAGGAVLQRSLSNGRSNGRSQGLDELTALAKQLLPRWTRGHKHLCYVCDEGGLLMCCDFCYAVCHPDTCLPKGVSAEAPLFACAACREEAAVLFNKSRAQQQSELYAAGRLPQLAALLSKHSSSSSSSSNGSSIFTVMADYIELLSCAHSDELQSHEYGGIAARSSAVLTVKAVLEQCVQRQPAVLTSLHTSSSACYSHSSLLMFAEMQLQQAVLCAPAADSNSDLTAAAAAVAVHNGSSSSDGSRDLAEALLALDLALTEVRSVITDTADATVTDDANGDRSSTAIVTTSRTASREADRVRVWWLQGHREMLAGAVTTAIHCFEQCELSLQSCSDDGVALHHCEHSGAGGQQLLTQQAVHSVLARVQAAADSERAKQVYTTAVAQISSDSSSAKAALSNLLQQLKLRCLKHDCNTGSSSGGSSGTVLADRRAQDLVAEVLQLETLSDGVVPTVWTDTHATIAGCGGSNSNSSSSSIQQQQPSLFVMLVHSAVLLGEHSLAVHVTLQVLECVLQLSEQESRSRWHTLLQRSVQRSQCATESPTAAAVLSYFTAALHYTLVQSSKLPGTLATTAAVVPPATRERILACMAYVVKHSADAGSVPLLHLALRCAASDYSSSSSDKHLLRAACGACEVAAAAARTAVNTPSASAASKQQSLLYITTLLQALSELIDRHAAAVPWLSPQELRAVLTAVTPMLKGSFTATASTAGGSGSGSGGLTLRAAATRCLTSLTLCDCVAAVVSVQARVRAVSALHDVLAAVAACCEGGFQHCALAFLRGPAVVAALASEAADHVRATSSSSDAPNSLTPTDGDAMQLSGASTVHSSTQQSDELNTQIKELPLQSEVTQAVAQCHRCLYDIAVYPDTVEHPRAPGSNSSSSSAATVTATTSSTAGGGGSSTQAGVTVAGSTAASQQQQQQLSVSDAAALYTQWEPWLEDARRADMMKLLDTVHSCEAFAAPPRTQFTAVISSYLFRGSCGAEEPGELPHDIRAVAGSAAAVAAAQQQQEQQQRACVAAAVEANLPQRLAPYRHVFSSLYFRLSEATAAAALRRSARRSASGSDADPLAEQEAALQETCQRHLKDLSFCPQRMSAWRGLATAATALANMYMDYFGEACHDIGSSTSSTSSTSSSGSSSSTGTAADSQSFTSGMLHCLGLAPLSDSLECVLQQSMLSHISRRAALGKGVASAIKRCVTATVSSGTTSISTAMSSAALLVLAGRLETNKASEAEWNAVTQHTALMAALRLAERCHAVWATAADAQRSTQLHISSSTSSSTTAAPTAAAATAAAVSEAVSEAVEECIDCCLAEGLFSYTVARDVLKKRRAADAASYFQRSYDLLTKAYQLINTNTSQMPWWVPHLLGKLCAKLRRPARGMLRLHVEACQLAKQESSSSSSSSDSSALVTAQHRLHATRLKLLAAAPAHDAGLVNMLEGWSWSSAANNSSAAQQPQQQQQQQCYRGLAQRRRAILTNCAEAFEECFKLDKWCHRALYGSALAALHAPNFEAAVESECDSGDSAHADDKQRTQKQRTLAALQQAKLIMLPLFEKRLEQVVNMWLLESPAEGQQALDSRRRKYNAQRRRYTTFYTALMQQVHDHDGLVKVLAAAKASKECGDFPQWAVKTTAEAMLAAAEADTAATATAAIT
jgi:hypothetical protein